MVHNERETLADSYTFAVSSSIQRLESVAIAEVDDSPDAHFEVGMLLSEVFVIGRSRETLVKAEELLRKGEELSPPTQRQFHALARAERLYEHGQVLATEWDLDHEVAGSRYRNAVKITLGQQKFQEGARYLARYAHFLSDNGLLEEALNTANKAVELDKAESEPLARYLQISLSQRLGELRTPAQIRSAEVQLDNIAGKLGAWPEAEASRTSLREELDRWHAVSEAGSTGSDWFGRVLDVGRACVQHGDAAKLTLCLLCKGILPASA
jgi:tetratricopeptide (TPR) repeat protein